VSEFVEINEHREHAEHAAHTKDPFAGRVSILVAVLAVVTAATGSLENTETAGAITEASHAVLDQDRATDQWNLYQAKSLKKNMFDIAASAVGPRAAAYAKKSAHEAADEGGAQAQAKALEHARDEALDASARHEKHHHRLAVAATLLEIGIAISTIAIITRRHWPWAMAAILGVGGVAIAVSAYL